ncbi:Fur family transcriptional regulator [Jeotgalibaca ciconiae]|uniref:Transcriptional repressor n=1 Tax=Jeotgalibaca ciconiae TaxID=2496265 RepID=A0A3S9HDN5_9LACT|nr:Fur family transcriptional regulator [Jeotgalibaca ciconiae]AZP05293.1 transcriptional repressor [Jeotgalibaca ciconiae]
MSEQSLASIKTSLQEGGFKLTPQREATVKVLLEKDHLSAEEIFMHLKQTNPDIGLATVYRTLEILTQLNITHKVLFEDGLARYDIRRESNKQFHLHLLCMECGKIKEIYDDLISDLEKEIEKKYHFQVEDHRLIFHGICTDCYQKRQNKTPELSAETRK